MKASFKIIQLATPNIDSFAVYSIASVAAYAQRHGYGHFVQRSRLLEDVHINWSKIALLEQELKAVATDFVMLLDADIIIANNEWPLQQFIEMGDSSTHIFMPVDTPIFQSKRPNAGMIIVRNSDVGREIISCWLHAAFHEGKHLADTHPRNQLVYWNYVQPRYQQYQKMIPRSFAAKYDWFTQLFGGKKRFLLHVTQTGVGQRELIMKMLYKKFAGRHDTREHVAELLAGSAHGLIQM